MQIAAKHLCYNKVPDQLALSFVPKIMTDLQTGSF